MFSNSMIEYLNKTIKYRYLYRQDVNDIIQLQSALDNAVQDYNNRPAHVLQGLTPLECLHNIAPDSKNTKEAIRLAARNRITTNKNDDCCG